MSHTTGLESNTSHNYKNSEHYPSSCFYSEHRETEVRFYWSLCRVQCRMCAESFSRETQRATCISIEVSTSVYSSIYEFIS
jgi:hypothetical protein